VLAAVVWMMTVGGHTTFESADYKLRIMGNETVVRDVVWPPLAMGFAETNGSESFRPPTWSAKAEIDEEGFYVKGARSVRVDEQSGVAQTAKPVEIRPAEPERNATFRHLVGTDSNGRDIMARILHGGRISLAVGILSTVLLVFLGVVIGATAGYFGGWVDILISRLIEIFQSIPAFFLILTAVTMIPDDAIHPIFAIVFFIAVVRWTGVARLVRAEFFKLKEQEFTVAARALGFSNTRVIFVHILPNAMGPVLVAAAFSVAAGILTESAISFLGLGVKEPIPSWGALLSEARGSTEYWWINIFPGLLIFMTVFCYNIVGEGVRDALDPRRKV
jgi:peptide/nickel transport system permease protein